MRGVLRAVAAFSLTFGLAMIAGHVLRRRRGGSGEGPLPAPSLNDGTRGGSDAPLTANRPPAFRPEEVLPLLSGDEFASTPAGKAFLAFKSRKSERIDVGALGACIKALRARALNDLGDVLQGEMVMTIRVTNGRAELVEAELHRGEGDQAFVECFVKNAYRLFGEPVDVPDGGSGVYRYLEPFDVHLRRG